MAVLEGEIAEVCGVVNAATGRLVDLIAKVSESGGWAGYGISSLEHWVTLEVRGVVGPGQGPGGHGPPYG